LKKGKYPIGQNNTWRQAWFSLHTNNRNGCKISRQQEINKHVLMHLMRKTKMFLNKNGFEYSYISTATVIDHDTTLGFSKDLDTLIPPQHALMMTHQNHHPLPLIAMAMKTTLRCLKIYPL
jgi:hypothetical protein